jgi:serine/threonine-protein kinase HipA
VSGHVPIWFDTFHVGDIDVGDDGELSFAYTQTWLATKSAFALSVTLPLGAEKFTDQTFSPWLANLLPEEEQLSVLARSLGLDRADTLAVLKEIGGDTAGALSFGTKSDRTAWAYTPLTEFYRVDD